MKTWLIRGSPPSHEVSEDNPELNGYTFVYLKRVETIYQESKLRLKSEQDY